MSDFTMAQAKRDFDRGLLKSVCILAVFPDTWTVQITSAGVDSSGWLVDAKKKQVRQMKSLDAAIAAVKEIGFEVKQLVVD